MKKRVFAVAIFCLLLLLACESETTGRRVAVPETGTQDAASASPTAAVATPQDMGSDKSAAEMLQEIKQNPNDIAPAAVTGSTSGTFYPPVTSDATGEDALREKTKALMSVSPYDPGVTADDQFGPRYDDPSDLPDEYGGNNDDE